MALEATYARAEVVLIYDRIELKPVMDALRSKADGELLPNWDLSSPGSGRLVLLSRTGSSAAIIDPRKTTLQTRYWGDFAKRDSVELRFRNMSEKLDSLLKILHHSTFAPLFVGIVTVVRVAAPDQESVDTLKKQLQQAPLSKAIRFQNIDWYDFLVRSSAALDENCFCITQVSWYEERVLAVLAQPDLPADFQVRDWELPVESTGIEFRFDINNKRGLQRGKRNWTDDDIKAIAERFHRENPALLANALRMAGVDGR